MSKIKVSTTPGERQRGAFSNPVVKWKYRITTGPRCTGMESTRNYKSADLAYSAGVRMAKKLDPSFKENSQ